jgi:uncharacterized HhH-GPD family protein
MTAVPSMVPVSNDRRRSTAAGRVWALVNADLRVGESARRRLGRPAAGWAVPELTSTPDIPQHHEAQQRGSQPNQGLSPVRCGRLRGVPQLRIAQDPAADELLGRDPLALLIGMLLDQQFPMERAFGAPRLLAERLGVDTLDAGQLAAIDAEELVRIFQGPPALHRYPGSMAGRTQDLCRLIVERYDGRPENLWAEAPDGVTLLRRIGELPGFGAQKAKIFLALLGKQCGVTPPGWREAAGDYGVEGSRRSVADITGPESLVEVRAFKQEQKQAAKAAKQTP